ncbi:LysR family transcriptional regulator [Pseudoclavibacter sp. 13-3]|uniref:LysR family transcriptional regulator n=1 Tax=Pseudoclavibacter sp. 13-3 TaxID=2901228 RepID=UPI001E38F9E7|nr:LysR family transcriptional regulator [Pseudoclavibacter sp. 13-3]MCD7101242.1 LysR family transcriptional regulator [Pseudoclavibacter sp. 13-3]
MGVNSEISIAQLVYFVHAAENGSMTAAADELYVAQSAVSTSISLLERRLGTTLFLRKRAKGLELTADGRELLIRARQILTSIRDAVDSVNPNALSGVLETACFKTLAPFYLPPIWARLSDACPTLQVKVTELSCPETLTALKDRRIDVALTYDIIADAAVHFEVLQERPAYIGLASNHPLASRSAISLRELADEPFILLNLPASREYFLNAFTSNGVAPKISYEFESFETVRGMVAGGHGYTLLNQAPSHELTYSGLPIAAVPVLEPVTPLNVVLAYRTGERLTAKAQAFTSICREVVHQAGALPVL